MERLTDYSDDECTYIIGVGNKTCEEFCKYVVDGCRNCYIQQVFKKLADYEDLEEQGLLVRLPCKVGDILFRINKGARNPIIKMKVSHITIKSKSYSIKAIEEDYGEVLFSNNVIGKTVFLTREEAEKKLEEMKKND